MASKVGERVRRQVGPLLDHRLEVVDAAVGLAQTWWGGAGVVG
jgi:hypothetical protein